MPKIKTIRDDILTTAEVLQTINDTKDLQTRAIISVLWITGCRVGELSFLKLKDLKNEEEYVSINMPTLKQRKSVLPRRKILFPKSSEFYRYLRDYVNSLHPKFEERILFDYSSAKIWYEMKKANPNIYPHLFRHSRATILSEKIDIFDLKYTFGWASMDMPQRYVHRKNSPERIFKVMDEE